MEVYWREGGARGKALKASLADAHRGGYQAKGEGAVFMGDTKRNGRGGQGLRSGWESSVDRTGSVIPHVTEGDLELYAVYGLGEDLALCGRVAVGERKHPRYG